jgi:nucleoside-diphosphate-sugar epimerase
MKKSNILITGSTGLIGNALLKSLSLEERYETVAMVHDIHKIANVSFASHIVTGDVRDFDFLCRVISEYEIDTIYHCAAQAIVRSCAADPVNAYETNVMGTLNLLEAVRTIGLNNIKSIVISTCHDINTKVVTPEGWKSYHEMKQGDKVLSINPITKEVEEDEVKEVLEYDYNGPLHYFKSKSIDFAITPNHKILDDKKTIIFKEAQKYIGLGLKQPIGLAKGKLTLDLPRFELNHHYHNRVKQNFNPKDLLYLLGIFIGDGCIQQQVVERKNKKNLGTSISNTIYLYIPYKDPCRPLVEQSLQNLGLYFSNWDHTGEGAITFSSKEICEWFKDAGHLAENKKIPIWCKDLDSSLLLPLIEGIMHSDGAHYSKKDIKYSRNITTISKQLVQDLSYICSKAGYHFISKFSKPSISFIKGRKIETQGCYRIHIKQTPKSIYEKHRSIEQYTGKVWCLRVKNNKNFLVVRNGKIGFSGNSDKAMAHTKPPYTELSPLCPKYTYEATKACQDIIGQNYFWNYGLPIKIVRCSNVYGPGDPNESRLIPGNIIKILNNEKPMIYSDVANYVREFIYIDDVVSAFRTVNDKSPAGEIYCVGGTEKLKVKELIEKLIELSGKTGQLEIEYPVKHYSFKEIDEQYIVSNKLRMLGWEPKVSLDEGLRKTIDYYLQKR